MEDTWVALVLVDQEIDLAFPFCLLFCVGSADAQGDHILNDEDAELIASAVVQVWLDFDLYGKSRQFWAQP